jgi:glycerol-3-phosphate acyltransferase PlsY
VETQHAEQSFLVEVYRIVLLRAIFAIVIGYLLGSIPTGYLVGKAWGVDVREHGSGRTGGTNVWRATKQFWPLALTVMGDGAKGIGAVLIGRYLLGSELAAALAGAGAVIGHNWSFVLRFRGGAGGITAGGALLALSPVAGVIVVVLALLLIYITRYASVATLTVGIGSLVVLTLLAIVAPQISPWAHVPFGILVAPSIVMALRPNLKRLAQGTERHISGY